MQRVFVMPYPAYETHVQSVPKNQKIIIFYVSYVNCHLSPTRTATATDPTPARSPIRHRKEKPKVLSKPKKGQNYPTKKEM